MKSIVRWAVSYTAVLLCLSALSLSSPAQAGDTVVYYHTDALHSVTVVTNAQGQVIERTYYAPYGAVLNRPMRDGPGYAGHDEDAATGLVYMQQRYYDPQIGQFLSPDPVQPDTTVGGNFNRYWYANDNPYRFTDPDGRAPDTDFGLGAMAVSIGGHPEVYEPLAPAAMVGTAIMAAPLAIGLGMAALANPATTTAIVNSAAEALAGDALGGTSLSVGAVGAAGALSRAKEIQSALSPRTQRAVTTAVAETEEGIRVVGSSEGALRPSQRAVMKPGEVAAKGARGTHAEVNAVNGARAQGLTPTSVSPSRPACPNCQQTMQKQRVIIKDRDH